MPDESDEVAMIPWDTLHATWLGLTAVALNYERGSDGEFELISARRLIEVEMREQGYEAKWEALTQG